ncbi:MAG: hypothetical protein JO347_03240 [Candidatus Eremiobacteraeota bacterium]|nr:hypothetical protein [Candidatus Eremiobacteraeota bacterium]
MPRAQRHLALVLAWWSIAPETSSNIRTAFVDATDLLALWPEIGEPAKKPGVHKLLIEVIKDKLQYHLYYRVRKRARRVDILMFRNAIRKPLKIY